MKHSGNERVLKKRYHKIKLVRNLTSIKYDRFILGLTLFCYCGDNELERRASFKTLVLKNTTRKKVYFQLVDSQIHLPVI